MCDISFHHNIEFLSLLLPCCCFFFIIISFLFLRPRRCSRNRLFELPRRKHSRTARDVLAQVAMEEGINGFVFKRKKKQETIQWPKENCCKGSLGSFAKSQVDTTKNIKNLPPMSNNLPTYPTRHILPASGLVRQY